MPEIITEVVKIRPIAGPILCSPTAMFTSVREHRGATVLSNGKTPRIRTRVGAAAFMH